jgi:hypothetical protein
MHAPARYRSWVTEAKDDAPAVPEPAQDSTEVPVDESPADAARRKFREALDRKNASPGTHPGSQSDGANSLKSSNGKRQRQFRRKSG